MRSEKLAVSGVVQDESWGVLCGDDWPHDQVVDRDRVWVHHSSMLVALACPARLAHSVPWHCSMTLSCQDSPLSARAQSIFNQHYIKPNAM